MMRYVAIAGLLNRKEESSVDGEEGEGPDRPLTLGEQRDQILAAMTEEERAEFWANMPVTVEEE